MDRIYADGATETLPKHTQTFLTEQGIGWLEMIIVLAERYITAHGDPFITKQKPTSPQKYPNTKIQTSKFGKSSGPGQHPGNPPHPPANNSKFQLPGFAGNKKLSSEHPPHR